MPLYEYKCIMENCKQKFEVLQKMNDEPLNLCGEHCKLPHEYTGCNPQYTWMYEQKGVGVVKKWLSPYAVRFKGSGFYETDYKKKK